MTRPVTEILLNGELYKTNDAYDQIYSVIEYVNALTGATSWTAGGFYNIDELPEEVLLSYFVDYYDAQVQQGGLENFILASHWNEDTNAYIRKGLERMGADRHLALFLELEITIAAVANELEELFIHDFSGDNPVKRAVDLMTSRYQEISEQENLTALNAAFIESWDSKKILSPRKLWQIAINALLEKVPDREARKRADFDRLSPEMKSILKVCDEAGHTLLTYHDFKLGDYEGNELFTHDITTDKGRFQVVFAKDNILLCNEEEGEIVARCKAFSED